MVTTEMFCRVWNASATPQDAATTLGMTLATASTWACKLRKKGVALKNFRNKMRAGTKLTVEEINALLEADAKAGRTVEELVEE